jgi:hypothetical protein
MTLSLKELASLLKYLNNNDLINIVEKPKSDSDSKSECIPLFIVEKNGVKFINEPFKSGLMIVREYLGKDIQVREGYKKFRRFNYRTSEELMRIIIAIWIPIFLVLLKIILEKIFKSNP